MSDYMEGNPCLLVFGLLMLIVMIFINKYENLYLHDNDDD